MPLLFLNGCANDDAKQALKQSLADIVSAVENKQHFGVKQKITTNFQGNNRFDQRTIVALIFRYTLRHKNIRIYTIVNAIEMAKDEHAAKMLFHAVLTSTKNTLPEHMRAFRIQSHWVKVEGDWKIKKARWVEVRAQSIYPEIKKQIVEPTQAFKPELTLDPSKSLTLALGNKF